MRPRLFPERENAMIKTTLSISGMTCGMCEGSGAVVRERIANPATGLVRPVTGTCPRCGGKGRRTRPVDALYTLFKAQPTVQQ